MKEKWEEFYNQQQIHKIQELEIQNLKVLKDICSNMGIEFFLYGGSLIGAVRHKGFVPWDDDLDIAMLRKDYDIFVKEAHKFLPSNYYLQTPYNDKKSPYFYSKLRLKGTKCVEFGTHKLNIEQGIYVDIYPIDKVPEDELEYKRIYNKYKKMIKLFVLRQCPYGYYPVKTINKKIKRMIKYFIAYILRIIPHKFYVKRLDKLMKYANKYDTNCYGNYSYPKPTNKFISVVPYEKGSFEGIEVNLPQNWDWHLRSRYGDYMKLPSIENRVGHKPYVLDFGEY